jgi:hypothetical protein
MTLIVKTPVPKKEIWKLCKVIYKINLITFPDYKVSNLGRIKRITDDRNFSKQTYKNKICKLNTHYLGYKRITLSKFDNSKLRQYVIGISRLVAHAFLGPCPAGYEVNHKNGFKENNMETNLEYLTRSENIKHAIKMKLLIHQKGSKVHNAILTEKKVRKIKNLLKNGISTNFLAQKYGVNKSTIKNIKSGRQWRHVRI